MVVALKPLHDLARIKRVVVATYQSVSGAGKEAMDELFDQTRGIFVNDPPLRRSSSPSRSPSTSSRTSTRFMDDGSTKEEWKMAVETRKILDPDIQVAATCVRVPVFIGHARGGERRVRDARSPRSEARDGAARGAGRHRDRPPRRRRLRHADRDAPARTPSSSSRIRRDPTVPHGLAFWCVGDNLRKGAALNAVQIAELALRNGLFGA